MFSSALLSMGLALLPFARAAVHDVQVGAGGLKFDPEAIFAAAGDQVVFHFHPKAHSVTQSAFANPCGQKPGGFDSGFHPVPANQTDNFPTWTVTVNDTQPVWVFCAQAANTPASHCGAGMVFAINCGADGAPNSFTNFKKSAMAIGASLSAGGASGAPTANGAGAATGVATAAYGDVTIPPAEAGQLATATITLQSSSTWTTTYTSYPNSPDPTPVAAEGAVHTVVVGGPGKLLFDPAQIVAKPRDTVVFEFHQKNHSVVQSSFDSPCTKLMTNGAPSGFNTGFMAIDDAATTFPTWKLTINDTAPIWGYCGQKTPASHCGAGMVFAINSNEAGARNYAAFQSLAEKLNGTAANSTAGGAPAGAASGAMGLGASKGVFVAVLAAVFAAML